MNELYPTEGRDLFDNIEAYYLHDRRLAPKEQEIAERFELAFALLQQHRNKKVAVSKLIALTKKSGKSLSLAQAYKDMLAAERIFVPIQNYSKEFLRLTTIESCIRDIKKIEEKMKNANDKDWQKFMELKNKAEYRLIQAAGLNDGSTELPDFSRIDPQPIQVNVSDQFLSLLQKLTDGGKVNVSDFMKQNSSEAEIID